ncbi:histidinol-phosphate transaminase [Virgibacillus sp. 179-BFC.A HS]|uniref:Histidinol-phosphate aminotransferase n=1 Tax=Tigheibacillus jepli TaxID=3035914 RepID=A0ABU5CIQ9_9BACI|nr:histidinol-phosphate transaminase [Virgibacillus sp. 179-BFC.A HS]MDY0405704.1 histidinol-phosphate transaminase [Virgibacillus sp. 179-BFC.A HS]
MDKQTTIDQLKPYQQGMQTHEVKAKFNLDRIVKLASNENPYGCSPAVKDAVLSAVNDLEIYPDGYAAALRTAIAEKIGVKEEQLVFGSGSDDLIGLICRTYLEPGTNTVMAKPTFGQYKQNALVEGAEIREIPLTNGYHDLDRMKMAIDHHTKIVWLCSPNNPSGTVIDKQALYVFINSVPDNIIIVLDEAYYEFMNDGDKPHLEERLDRYRNVIVMRTFSKAYGLAGLRIGYAICHASNSKKLNAVRPAFNTSSVAQKAALAAFKDSAFLEKTVTRNNVVKASFEQFLDGLGWQYEKSQTNFMLVHTPVSGDNVFDFLIKKGFIVRSGEVLGCPNTVRITLGRQEDMLQLQACLQQFDQQLKKERMTSDN